MAVLGFIGCASDGLVDVGNTCRFEAGVSDCAIGRECVEGVCRALCDLAGGAPQCARFATCEPYADYFVIDGKHVAGVCALPTP
jgi:hypothetical protein